MSDSVDMMANGAAGILGGALMYTTEKALGKAGGLERIRPFLMLARDSISELIGAPEPASGLSVTDLCDGVVWTRLAPGVLVFSCEHGVAFVRSVTATKAEFVARGDGQRGTLDCCDVYGAMSEAMAHAARQLKRAGWV